jgi:hypothetical protein
MAASPSPAASSTPTEPVTKRGIFDDIENSYLLAYVCRKPHHPKVGTSFERAWCRVAGTQATPRRALGRARRMLAR